jgi:hypothetical protein
MKSVHEFPGSVLQMRSFTLSILGIVLRRILRPLVLNIGVFQAMGKFSCRGSGATVITREPMHVHTGYN